jgi:aspartyl-tRNA(Asn)/glutamyl-tRNA(Gln) amidotransferase subunit C
VAEDEVRRIARLARLDLDEAGLARLERELGSILDSMSSLDQAGSETTTHTAPPAASGALPPLRADVVEPCLGTEAALANAPDGVGGLFRVPRSLEE